MSATLTIDDSAAGGSSAGAWATAIAHTPHLAAQVSQITRGVFTPSLARADEGRGTVALNDAVPSSDSCFQVGNR